jgi:peptidoglycan/xylan/chitin deacetylase (PgdA/CDA1 family)
MLSRARALLLAQAGATAGAVKILGWSALSVGLPGIFFALFADGVARSGSSVLYPTWRHGPRDVPRVALTFDDGPDPDVTPAVLDVLAVHGARATFFAIGRALDAHPELARRVSAEGHELANHSYGHSRWGSFSGVRTQVADIERGERALAAIAAIAASGRQPLYRAPFGVKSPPFVVAANAKQLTMISWSLHSRDSIGANPGKVAARVLRRIRPGDIVVMHDGHDLPGRHRAVCVDALPRILAGLRERGLECVTVSELLHPPIA